MLTAATEFTGEELGAMADMLNRFDVPKNQPTLHLWRQIFTVLTSIEESVARMRGRKNDPELVPLELHPDVAQLVRQEIVVTLESPNLPEEDRQVLQGLAEKISDGGKI